MRVSAISKIDFQQTAQPIKPTVCDEIDREDIPEPRLPKRVGLLTRVWRALTENDKEYDIQTQQLDYVV